MLDEIEWHGKQTSNRNAVDSHSHCDFTSIRSRAPSKPNLVIRWKFASSHAVGYYCQPESLSSLLNLVSNCSDWLQHYVAALQLTAFCAAKVNFSCLECLRTCLCACFWKVPLLQAYPLSHCMCGHCHRRANDTEINWKRMKEWNLRQTFKVPRRWTLVNLVHWLFFGIELMPLCRMQTD